jgi:hypothetical protein
MLKDLTKVSDLSVSFRSDYWFLEAHEFPLVFPLLRKIALPNQTYVLAQVLTVERIRMELDAVGGISYRRGRD